MKIAPNAAVSLRVEILDEGGALTGAQELVYLHGHGNLFPKVEAALDGLEAGRQVSVRLAPADAFGERDPALVRRERRERLPPNVALGSQLQGQGGPAGDAHAPVFRVTELTDTEATLDGNHPLAGRTVELRCRVEEVRAATPEELAHGHAHGPDGDHAH
jgi:FKBP-type peptidyl-prolyl cis-trans isomerase SlyD